MTISSENRKSGPFLGTGAVSEYPFDFTVFVDDDLNVVMADTFGAESTLVLNSDYTVNLNADQDANPGGTVVLTNPLADDFLLVLTSQLPNLQPTDLTNQGGFYPQVVTRSLDRLTILVQQLKEQISRAVKVPITAAFDATADALIARIISAESSSSADAASAAASAAAAATFTPALYVLKAGDSITGNLQMSAGTGYITASANMGNHPSHSGAFVQHTPVLRNLTANASTLVGAVGNGTGTMAGFYARLDSAVADVWGGLTVESSVVRLHSSASNNAVSAPPFEFAFKGVKRVGISNAGVIDSYGLRFRQGTAGAAPGNAINLYWTGTVLEVWVDTTRIGTVNITP
jgi:hypothetical protein